MRVEFNQKEKKMKMGERAFQPESTQRYMRAGCVPRTTDIFNMLGMS